MSIESNKTSNIELGGRRPLKLKLADYLYRLAENLAGKNGNTVTKSESLGQENLIVDNVNKEPEKKEPEKKEIQADEVTQEYFDSLGKDAEHILSNDLALGMIDKGKIRLLASNLDKFTNLEEGVSLILADNGYYNEIIDNNSSFWWGLSNNLALKMIDKGKIGLLVSNLNKFKDLEEDVSLKLADNGYYNELMENNDSFGYCFSNELALKMINKGKISILADNLDMFDELNNEVIGFLFNSGYYEEFMKSVENYDDNDDIDLSVENIKKLIENGNFDRVMEHVDLDKFEFDDNILELLIEKGYGEWVICYYDVNLNMAESMIKKGLGNYLVGYCALDDEANIEMIKLLINSNLGKNVIEERCHIDNPNVLQSLFENGYVEDVAPLLGNLYEDDDDIERDIYELYEKYDVDY